MGWQQDDDGNWLGAGGLPFWTPEEPTEEEITKPFVGLWPDDDEDEE